MVIKTLLVILFMLPSIAMSAVELDSNDDGKIDLSFIKSGVAVGDIVVYEDVGSGVVGLPLAEVYDGSTNNGNLATTVDTLKELNDAVDDLTISGTPAISNITDWPVGVVAAEVGYLDGVTSGLQAQIDGIGGSSVTEQAADPTDVSATGFYCATTSGDCFYKSTGGLFNFALGTYTGDPLPATLTCLPTTFDPADAAQGAAAATQTVTCTANNSTVTLSSISLGGANYFTDAGTGTCTGTDVLSAAASCTIDLVFAYTLAGGPYSDTLTVVSDVADSPDTVTLGPVTVGAFTGPADDFGRPNETPIAGNWTTAPGFEDMNLDAEILKVGTTEGGIYWNAVSFADNQYAEVTFPNSYKDGGPAVRLSGSTTKNGYLLSVNSSTGGRVIRYVAGAVTVLDTFTGLTFNTADVWRISITGSAISATQNGTPITFVTSGTTTITDSSHASGSAGIIARGNGAWFDDFAAGDL